MPPLVLKGFVLCGYLRPRGAGRVGRTHNTNRILAGRKAYVQRIVPPMCILAVVHNCTHRIQAIEIIPGIYVGHVASVAGM